MTFVSLAQAARRLGIDAKTLRRWLAEAQLPLHSHPHDGRKKGVSAEHLQALARQHQRRLTGLPEEPPAPTPREAPELSDVLLALPERLDTVQTQLSALAQQVAALTHLLQQHASQPVGPPATKPSRRSTRPPTPASAAARSHPAASAAPTTPRQPVHVIPRVEYGPEGHYVVTCPKHGVLPFEPDTPAWFAWVAQQDSFRFVGQGGHFTAHHEWRVPKGAWRAHWHIRNHVHSLRLAPAPDLTIAVLEQAAVALQTHLT
jgi:transposase-like protein